MKKQKKIGRGIKIVNELFANALKESREKNNVATLKKNKTLQIKISSNGKFEAKYI